MSFLFGKVTRNLLLPDWLHLKLFILYQFLFFPEVLPALPIIWASTISFGSSTLYFKCCLILGFSVIVYFKAFKGLLIYVIVLEIMLCILLETWFSTELAFSVRLKFGLSLTFPDKGLSYIISGKFSEDFEGDPADICLFKVNYRNTRTGYKICSKLTIKTPEMASFWCLYC